MDKASEACTARFQQELAKRAFNVELSLGRYWSVCNALAHIYCESSDSQDIKFLAEKAILSWVDIRANLCILKRSSDRVTSCVTFMRNTEEWYNTWDTMSWYVEPRDLPPLPVLFDSIDTFVPSVVVCRFW